MRGRELATPSVSVLVDPSGRQRSGCYVLERTVSAMAAEAVTEGRLLPLYGRGFVAVSAAEVDRLAELPPATVAVWAVLRLEAARRGGPGADLPRSWLVERTGLPITPDTLKKVPARVRALATAGLCLSLVGDAQRVRVEFPRRDRRRAGRGTGEWEPRLRASDVARAVDPSDPMTWSDLTVWLRWQQLVRVDEVWVTQAELAKRWAVDERTVRREQNRLHELGLLGVDRTPGGVCRYWAAEIVTRAQIRVLGAGTTRWIHDGTALAATTADTPPRQDSGATDSPSSRLGGPDNLGTRSGQSEHQPMVDSLTRTREHAVALHTVGTSVPQSPNPAGTDEGAGASPEPQLKSSSERDWAWRQACRIVAGQSWLTNSAARWKVVSTLASLLRRDLPGVDPARATHAVGRIDPGESTDQHVRLVRQAIAGLVADTKAAANDNPRKVAQRRTTATNLSSARTNTADLPDHDRDQPGTKPATIDLSWVDGEAGPEPRWEATSSADPGAAQWLATLWLRSPSVPVPIVQRRLPPQWQAVAGLIHDQVMVARTNPGRQIRLGGLPA